MVSSAFTGQQALQPLPSDRERRFVADYPLTPTLVEDGIPVLKVTKVGSKSRPVSGRPQLMLWLLKKLRKIDCSG